MACQFLLLFFHSVCTHFSKSWQWHLVTFEMDDAMLLFRTDLISSNAKEKNSKEGMKR